MTRRALVVWIAGMMLATAGYFLVFPVVASDGFFEGPHPTYGEDVDADNRFEYLRVDARVNVTAAGDFTVEGLLYDGSGSPLITSDQVSFTAAGLGLHIATIRFPGPDIFASELNGSYQVTLRLLDDTLTFLEADTYLTGYFDYVAFGPIFAFTSWGHTERGVDTDGNGRYNFIQANVSANVSLQRTFFLFGIVFASEAIDMKIRVANLTEGDHIITLNFSGVGAFIRGDDGPYNIYLQASMSTCNTSEFQDEDSFFTGAYFFTDFESAIKRDLTGTVWNDTTNQPVANETLWLTNATHRYLTVLSTNATGDFQFVAFEGDFVLLAGADGLQDQAVPITIVGDTNVIINLTREPADPNEITLTMGDWGNVTMHSDRWGIADNQSQRFMTDQFVGNGDLVVDADESQDWMDLFFSCFQPFNDTTGQFEVDGIAFDLVNGTWVQDADATGAVTSTAAVLMTMDGNFTAKSPIPVNPTHQVLLNVTYDNNQDTEVFFITFPTAWVLDSYWPPANVTVSGLNNNTITVDPLGRPSGGPRGADVILNATLDSTPPTVSNVSDVPDPQEVFGNVNITATVTDNSGVAAVAVDVYDPLGGQVCNCTMVLVGADSYSYEASYGMLGVYNYTVWAKDDAGLFSTGLGTFTMQDTTAPVVGTPSAAPDPQEAALPVDFAVNVTDNFQVNEVTITFEEPDGSPGNNRTMTLVGGNYTEQDTFTKLGLWNYTIWASDTSGNWASQTGNFTIVDNTGPTILNVSATPDPQEVFGNVAIYANVTDNSGVDLVTVNITNPLGGTVGNFTMIDQGFDLYRYEAAFGLIGLYTYVVWALDDGGLYSSQSGNFTMQDTTLPVITSPNASPDPQEAGLPVSFTAQVTDNYQVDLVTIAIRDPASALVGNFTMLVDVTGNYTYARSFSDLGTYSYTIWARDTSGNYASAGGSFLIQDTTPPVVTNAWATPNPQEVYFDVTVTADVVENSGVSVIQVHIWDPDGLSVGNFSMAPVDSDTYDYTFVAPNEVGMYTFEVWVQDNAGLWGSFNHNFLVEDTTAPSIGPPAADPDPQVIGGSVSISATVSDNYQLDTVDIEVVDPNATLVGNFTMTPSGGEYSYTAAYDVVGTYTYTIWACDSSGNCASQGGQFVIQDTTPPSVGTPVATPDPQEVSGSVTLTVTASDNYWLVSVRANVVDPSGTTLGNFSMTLSGGEYTYGASYGQLGTHTYTIWACDSSGNCASQGGQFVIQDTTAPQLANDSATPDPQEIGALVAFAVEASDNYALDTVTIALYDPQDTLLANQTMTLVDGKWTYAAAFNDLGVHRYTIAAVDTSGNWAVVSGTFTTQDTTAPVVEPVQSFSIQAGVEFTVDVDGSTDNGEIVNITWDFGDGARGYGSQVDHTYTTPGEYTVRVTVRDASGNEGVESFTITVLPPETGGADFPGTALWGIIAAIAAAAATAGYLMWRRKGRPAPPKRPPAPPPKEVPVKVEKVEPVDAEPEPEEEDIIEELLRL